MDGQRMRRRGGRDTLSECVTQERLRKYANVHCQGRAFVTLGLTTSETGFCLTPVSSSSTSTSHMRASTDAAAVGPCSKSGTFSRCRIFIDGNWWTISVWWQAIPREVGRSLSREAIQTVPLWWCCSCCYIVRCGGQRSVIILIPLLGFRSFIRLKSLFPWPSRI